MEALEELASKVIKKVYIQQGVQNLHSRQNLLKQLLDQKKLPRQGWGDAMIEFVINELSEMDSNNFASNCGAGEREGRLYSSLVAKRNFRLSHGIGRSGDITEVQPKAAGSSLLYILCEGLVKHSLEVSGLSHVHSCVILPLATGMSLSMTFLTLRKQKPHASLVIWPRIDQKSCFKSILTADLVPLIVENVLNADDTMSTDVDAIERLISEYGPENILCVCSTTSCFAPRQPDEIDKLARLCMTHGVGHIINNAYGLQCKTIAKLINRACTIGRVDAVVQSTDKNFMVPVGGAIVWAPRPDSSTPLSPNASTVKNEINLDLIPALSALYPGRASMAPVLDLFITLLSMGEAGYRSLLTERQRLLPLLSAGLNQIANKFGEKILPSPRNCISLGLSLRCLESSQTFLPYSSATRAPDAVKHTDAEAVSDVSAPVAPTLDTLAQNDDVSTSPAFGRESDETSGNIIAPTPHRSPRPGLGPTFLGSMLFQRSVSGCRAVACSPSPEAAAMAKVTEISGYKFRQWGSHHDTYPCSYLTAACAVGMTEKDVTLFLARLEKTIGELLSKRSKINGTTSTTPSSTFL